MNTNKQNVQRRVDSHAAGFPRANLFPSVLMFDKIGQQESVQ